jgi:hypothetical protein
MKPFLNLAAVLAATLAIALLADSWRSARRDAQQLAATLAAQNATIQQSADREKQRDAQLAAALAAIQSQKRAVRTPQQAATELPSVLPELPLPITVHEPILTTPLPPGEQPPAATISIPQPDLLPLYDTIQDCRASAAENNTLQKDLADEKARSAAFLTERNAALQAAHGGPILQRLKRAAKWFALGAITATALTLAATPRTRPHP